MNLFEWLGEAFSPGSLGTVEFGQEPIAPDPLYLVLLKFVVSATLILLIDGLVFYHLVAPTPRTIAIAVGIHVIYLMLSYFVRPVPDESNLGLFGSVLNDPFSVSDNVNRSLLLWQVLLLPGRFVSEAIVNIIALVFGFRRRTRRESAIGLPAIAVPRGIRRAVPLVGWSILCIGGAVMAYQTWSYGIETKAWVAVEASVLERWAEGRKSTLAGAKMRIEYQVDGETYRSVLNGYSPDARTTIYIDPENHARVSLQLGVAWPKFAIFVGLSAVGGLGVLAWLALTVWPQLASEDYLYAEREA